MHDFVTFDILLYLKSLLLAVGFEENNIILLKRPDGNFNSPSALIYTQGFSYKLIEMNERDKGNQQGQLRICQVNFESVINFFGNQFIDDLDQPTESIASNIEKKIFDFLSALDTKKEIGQTTGLNGKRTVWFGVEQPISSRAVYNIELQERNLSEIQLIIPCQFYLYKNSP